MKTSLYLSTITWNSKPFLDNVLKKLIDIGDIEYYQYIYHLPDTDGKKEHYHLFLFPAKKIDTVSLRSVFTEEVVGDLPIRPLPFQKVKDYSDWYLYSLHDLSYLARKGLTRLHHYTAQQFVYSDENIYSYLEGNVSTNYTRLDIIESAVLAEVPFEQLIAQKSIPANQVVGFKMEYDYMWQFYHKPIFKGDEK